MPSSKLRNPGMNDSLDHASRGPAPTDRMRKCKASRMLAAIKSHSFIRPCREGLGCKKLSCVHLRVGSNSKFMNEIDRKKDLLQSRGHDM